MPERIVTLWLADWPVVAAGFAPDTPAAVMAANRVVARTPAAAADGVVIGQRRRQAQRRCPHIELVDHDPARDARQFEPVVRAVAELSPRLDVIEPGWISLAARGPSRYFGGDAAVADRLVDIASTSASAGVGIADGRFASGVAARVGARRGHPVIVDPGGSEAFCAGLSMGWLQTLGEIQPDMVDLFGRLGLRRLGDLAALDEADVLGRFGYPGVHAHRLACGADARPSSTVDPRPDRQCEQTFDDPVPSAEPLVFAAKRLADHLASTLAREGCVCVRLVVVMETEHGERSERAWYRSNGMSASAMVERVRWQLDGWINLPRGSDQEITGGVVLIRLVPDEIRADEGQQLGLWGGQSDDDRRAARTIARLSAIVADDAVTVPVWRGGRLPADRYHWVPASTADLDARRSATASGPSGPWPGSLPSPSPSTVFTEPQPIEMLGDDGQPLVVGGRGALSSPPVALRVMVGDESVGWELGRLQTISGWAGPWPIEERWWDPARSRRLAQLQVMTDDDKAYLVVAEHRRWWITAVYD